MVELSGRSPGVSVREIDLTGPQNVTPVGVPAGVIGAAERGPAFVPVTVGSLPDFVVKFGGSDGTKFGPIAVAEWLRNARAVTFLRVLGAGRGEKRLTTGNNLGSVEGAGFVVGQQIPGANGNLGDNAYANSTGPKGRMHILGTYMSESNGSSIFSDAGIAHRTATVAVAVPIVRGIVMAASGVVPMLSSSVSPSGAPAVAQVATSAGPNGAMTGSVDLLGGNQNFVLLLNGHKGNDASYPNVITASFDQTAPNYLGNVLNQDPTKIEVAGHYLYSHYDIHPSYAAVTGTGVIAAGNYAASAASKEPVAFLLTGSAPRNTGATTAPNYENFEDRYSTPSSPTVISQKFGGNPINLFRVFMLSDGRESNEKYKISIQNIAKSNVNDDQFGTFDLLVRRFGDTDENRVILESFSGLNLDPTSQNYIGRRIGDLNAYYDFDKNSSGQKLVVEGKYPNVSNLIRVAIDQRVDDEEISPTSLPIGFRGPAHLITSGSDPLTAISGSTAASAGLTDYGNEGLKRVVELPIPFRDNIAQGIDPKVIVNKSLYWGVQFTQKTSLTEPNSSKVENKTIRSLTKYFPNFQTSLRNVQVGENAGVANSNGTVLDSDLYNNNIFSLDRIQVRTASNGIVDAKELASMSYVRNGQISANAANKTRALSVATDFGDLTVRTIAKFNFFVQGGYDGTNIFDKESNELTNIAVKQEMDDSARHLNNGSTVKSYRKGLQIMGDTTDVDIKLLAIPGIRHSVVSDAGVDTVENDRFDALYIMDVEERDEINAVVTASVQNVHVTNTATQFNGRGLDSSFAAAYFPDVVINNPFTNLPTQVPPSVAVLGAFSLNDSVGFPWNAPAGFVRGALQTTDNASLLLNRSNMDTLQDASINPLVSFPGSDGVVVFGQKTLHAAQSAVDRVNVRRLMIEIRRQVRSISNQIIFEPNRESTLNRFSSLVNPVLQRIQEQQGVARFKVIIDTTTTTQADIENNTIRGKIFVEPTRVAEVISVDFVVSNAGSDA